jgi:tRNA dimethylallyltransferase
MLRQPILLVVCGPTAVGKTELAIRVARQTGRAEIISADSRQVYRGMEIGTAKPTAEEQRAVPHHLFDLRDPDQTYSAGDFAADARACLDGLRGRGILPIMVGGSGLYVQAALDGLDEPAASGTLARREELLARLAHEGVASLYEELGRVDPVAQARLAPGDTRRILRALELAAAVRAGHAPDERVRRPLACTLVMVCLEMDREALYRRIDGRVERMLAHGLLDEARDLRAKGYDRDCPGCGSLGYREAFGVLDGCCSIGEAVESISRRTRQYAKRQWTWFRHDRRFRWLDLGALGLEGAADRILAQLAAEGAR